MKYFIDTANMDEIKEIHEWGVLSGVTTNPSLVAKEKDISFHNRLVEICELVGGPVSGEVIALDAAGMIEEGRELAKLHEHIIVKIPMTEDGMKAVKVLSEEGIKTNVTLVFNTVQALTAARAGAAGSTPARAAGRARFRGTGGAGRRGSRPARSSRAPGPPGRGASDPASPGGATTPAGCRRSRRPCR